MKVVKYLGAKRSGMPVSFPIGSKSKSAVTHVKVAAPFLSLTDEDAEALLALDAERVKESGRRMRPVKNDEGKILKHVLHFDKPEAEPLWVLAEEEEAEAFLAAGGKNPAPSAGGLASLTDDEIEAELARRKAAAKKAPKAAKEPKAPKAKAAKKAKEEEPEEGSENPEA